MKLKSNPQFYLKPDVEMVKFLKIAFQDIVQFHFAEDVDELLINEQDILDKVNQDIKDVLYDASAAFKQANKISVSLSIADEKNAVMFTPANTFTRRVLTMMDGML